MCGPNLTQIGCLMPTSRKLPERRNCSEPILHLRWYAVCYNSGSNSSDNDNDNVVSRVYSTDEQSLRSYEGASTFRFNPSADRSRDARDIRGDDVEGPCSTLSAINADRDKSRL